MSDTLEIGTRQANEVCMAFHISIKAIAASCQTDLCLKKLMSTIFPLWAFRYYISISIGDNTPHNIKSDGGRRPMFMFVHHISYNKLSHVIDEAVDDDDGRHLSYPLTHITIDDGALSLFARRKFFACLWQQSYWLSIDRERVREVCVCVQTVGRLLIYHHRKFWCFRGPTRVSAS